MNTKITLTALALAAVATAGADNRPNTFFEGFEGRAAGGDAILYRENNYLPEGWSDVSKADPANLPYPDCTQGYDITWTTLPNNALKGVSPYGTCYAHIDNEYGPTPEVPQDEWLISPAITIQQDDVLQFMLCYSPYLTIRSTDPANPTEKTNVLEVNISTDDGQTWTPLFNTYDEALKLTAEELYANSVDMNSNSDFKPVFIEIPEYYGKTVRIAFRYYGKRGAPVSIDNVTIGIPYPTADYVMPASYLYPALCPDMTEPLQPYFYAPAGVESVWTNLSTNAKEFDWTYTDEPGTTVSHARDLVTPAYPAGVDALMPTLVARYGINSTEPYAIAGKSHLDPDGIPSALAQIRYGAPTGMGTNTMGSLRFCGAATYNYFDPDLIGFKHNHLFEFSADVDGAWEAVLGSPVVHEEPFVIGIGQVLPQPAAPYGIDRVFITSIVNKIGADTRLTCTIHNWETETIAGVSYSYVGDAIASATVEGSSLTADGGAYQAIDFDFSQCPATITRPAVILITGFNRETDYIRFPYLSSNSERYNGSAIMTFHEIDSNTGELYNAVAHLSTVPMSGGGHCAGILMGMGIDYSTMELSGEKPALRFDAAGGAADPFIIKTSAPVEKLVLLDGSAPCSWLKMDVAPLANEGEYEITISAQPNESSAPRNGNMRIATTGSYVEFTAYQKAKENSIDAIGADSDIPAVYYNLQGVRIDTPSAPGLYIRRVGDKAEVIML